jgi:hypothetical protein
MVTPGKYTAQLFKRQGGVSAKLTEPVAFEVLPDPLSTLKADDFAAIAAFNKEVRTAGKQLLATTKTADELTAKVDAMRKAIKLAAKPDDATDAKLTQLAEQLRVLKRKLNGDSILAARQENVPDSIASRISYAGGTNDDAVALPTGTAKQSLKIGLEELAEVTTAVRGIAEKDVPAIEKALDAAGVPWTPGRLPPGK